MLLNLQPFLVLESILLRQHPDKNHYLTRSSCSQIFLNIGVLKNLAIFTGKHLCWSLFIEKRLQHRRFSVNIAKFLRIAFLQNTSSCSFHKNFTQDFYLYERNQCTWNMDVILKRFAKTLTHFRPVFSFNIFTGDRHVALACNDWKFQSVNCTEGTSIFRVCWYLA